MYPLFAMLYSVFPHWVSGTYPSRKCQIKCLQHPRLTRVRRIRFHLFEIKRMLVYNSFILYFFIQNLYADKNKY